MPVPPVVMITCVPASPSRSVTRVATSAGSSRTMSWPETSCPADSSSWRMAAPPVSVSGVRVSLTVST